jgi:hypothetical protein
MISHTEGGTWADGVPELVPRKILGHKRDKGTRELRRLHNEQLYYLYFSPNIIQ